MSTHYQNPYLPHARRTPDGPDRPAAPKRGVVLPLDSDGLPIGTAAQVIAWVDDDPDRAARFLVKEQRENRPRVTLVANLRAILKRNDWREVQPELTTELPGTVVAPVHIEEGEDVLEAVRRAISPERNGR